MLQLLSGRRSLHLPLQDGAVLAPDGDQPRVVRQEAEPRHVAAVAAVHVSAARDLARGRAVEGHGARLVPGGHQPRVPGLVAATRGRHLARARAPRAQRGPAHLG